MERLQVDKIVLADFQQRQVFEAITEQAMLKLYKPTLDELVLECKCAFLQSASTLPVVLGPNSKVPQVSFH